LTARNQITDTHINISSELPRQKQLTACDLGLWS